MNKVALLYHEVTDDCTESGFQNKDNLAYMHKIDVFKKHILLYKSQLDKFNPQNEYLFTFDDGGISNLRSSQILEDNNINGLYFITTNKIDSKGFLKEQDIKQLDVNGHVIGSHSHTHPMIFKSLSYNKMLDEWRISKDILENIVQHEITSCSIPGGDADIKTYESACECGFKFIYDSEPIITRRQIESSKIIGRLSIKASLSDDDFLNVIKLNNLSTLQRNRKIKSIIKKAISPLHQYIQNKKNE